MLRAVSVNILHVTVKPASVSTTTVHQSASTRYFLPRVAEHSAVFVGRRLYGDGICFANVDYFRIDFADTSKRIFTKL